MIDPHSKKGSPSHPSKGCVSKLFVAGALVLVVLLSATTFMHQNHFLHHAVTLHSKALRLEMKESDWVTVWNIADISRDYHEFIALLKSEGMIESDSNAPPSPESDAWMDRDQAYEHLIEEADALKQAALEAKNNTVRSTIEKDYGDDAKETLDGPRDVTDYEEGELYESENYEGIKGLEEFGISGSKTPDTSGSTTEGLSPIDGNPPPFSAKLAKYMGVNDTVIVTWANYALWDFVKSWVRHVEELGITNFLVGAMDRQIGEIMVQAGIPSFSMYPINESHSGVGADHLQWGGASFHKMGRQKIALAKTFLDVKMNLLLVDADVVILRNVLEYFNRYPEADILVSTDLLTSTLEPGDEGLEIPHAAGAPMNIGIMYFKYGLNTSMFVNAWLDAITADAKLWDQNAFNDMIRAGSDPYNKLHPNNERVFIGYNDSIGVGVLPSAMFSGGHTYYIQKLHEVQQVEPYAVHCTFQYGGNAGKRNRMREAMIFYDDDEYYTADTYIMADVVKSPNMSSKMFNDTFNYTEMKAYNRKGLEMQMESVYPAIGLSFVFNRTYIVPRLACYCDRSWVPLERCRMPGATKQRLPFECPMDYVLDPVFLTDDVSPDFKVRWREHSFLENPRCPMSVKRSKLTIYSDESISSPVEEYRIQDGGTVLILPPKMRESDLMVAMGKYEQYKVWHFKDAGSTFSGIEDDPRVKSAYQNRIDHLHPVTQPDFTSDGKIPM